MNKITTYFNKKVGKQYQNQNLQELFLYEYEDTRANHVF